MLSVRKNPKYKGMFELLKFWGVFLAWPKISLKSYVRHLLLLAGVPKMSDRGFFMVITLLNTFADGTFVKDQPPN